MTTAFVFPVENHTLLWNTCKYTSYITEPFFAHKNVPIQSLAGINEKLKKNISKCSNEIKYIVGVFSVCYLNKPVDGPILKNRYPTDDKDN